MNCPRCRTLVTNGRRFCGDCGTPVPWICSACGGENSPGQRFCGDCGAGSGAATDVAPQPQAKTVRGPLEADRRQLTVMFADLVGSTALSARLDPEDLRDVMGAWRQCAAGLVAHSGGQVIQFMGDGILALFGYPRAHEADAERAVRTGLAVIEAVRQLDTVAGPPGTLSTRVGLATGLVIVGDLIGPSSAIESAVVGEAPNLAARLQTLAQPDTVVIDHATRQLTGGMFEYVVFDPIYLKGMPAPVRPATVLRESTVENRFEALRTNPFPLVDREEEMDLLLRRWATARTGAGRAVVLVGEPGLGKSRLIAAFEDRLGPEPRSVVRLLCSPHYQDTPLYPLIRYFERAADIQRNDLPAAKYDKLRSLLESTGQLNQEELDSIADLLSIQIAPGSPPDRLTPLRKKELTFRTSLRHFSALAAQAPMLAIVEDFHWADPTTTTLLDALVDTVERLPVLIVIATRPERGMHWSLHPQVTIQILNGLDRHHAATLVRQFAGENKLQTETIGRMVARAEGVPLFLEELTRSLLVSSPTFSDDGRPGSAVPLSINAIPSSLKALLTARLDQLATSKEVAQASSVIGREFSFELLQTVSGVPTEQLVHALEELAQAGLIVPHGNPPDATYVFHHVLIQDAAYASMLRERRHAIHLRLAQALEKDPTGPATTSPEVLAAHFAEAGVAEKSVHYYLKATARATGRFALTEIIGYLQKGLRQLAKLPPTRLRQQRELEMTISLGRALMEHRGSGDDEVFAAFDRAHELCLELGDCDQILHAHDGLTNYHIARAELDKVVEHADRILELGHRTKNRQALLMAHRSHGHAQLLLGRFHLARNDLEQVISLYEGETTVATRDPKASGYAALGICLTALGLPDAGASASIAAVNHAESLAQSGGLNLALRRACIQWIMQRNANEVLALSGRLLDRQTEFETFRGSREGAFFATWAQLQFHQEPALLGQLRTMVDQFEAAKHLNMLTFFMVMVVELLQAHDDMESAAALLRRTHRLAELTNERWCEAEMIRLDAHLTEDASEASRLLKTSLDLARDQGALLWEVRAAADLAKLLRNEGQCEAAFAVLSPVVTRLTEGSTSSDFVAARALLETLKCSDQ